MKMLVNLRDHFLPTSVYKQTIADPSKAAPRRNPARSCNAVALSVYAHTVSSSKEFFDRKITLDGASAVSSSKFFTAEEVL
jgi:hypothetical protein